MRLDGALNGTADSPFARISPRVLIAATLLFAIGVVLTPAWAWRAMAVEAIVLAFAVGFSRVDPDRFLRRWLAVLALAGPLSALLAVSHPERPALGYGAVLLALLAKNGMALMAMTLLASVLTLPKLTSGLRGLGMPPVLVCSLQFMLRHLTILADEMERMVLARRARSFRRSGRISWWLRSSLIGAVFVRSLERGERQHAAMLARGWDGHPRWLDAEHGG